MKKIITIFSILIIIILLVDLNLILKRNADKNSRFKVAKDYSITEENVFIYRNAKDIIKILEDGTGAIVFCSKENEYCKYYLSYVNEASNSASLEKIYLVDITKDKNRNSKSYQKIVSLLHNNLLKDTSGNRQIYIPNLTVVLNGMIIGNNNLSAMETVKPTEYWTKERETNFKKTVERLISPLVNKTCYACR